MESTKQQIIKRLKEKSTVKYKVYDNTLAVFEEIKKVITDINTDIKQAVEDLDIEIPVEYRERGKFEIEMKVAGDMVLMTMHTNVFKLPDAHFAMQSRYVKEDEMRSYCGIINIYNFLADSFKYNRRNDIGYLIGRIFINKDKHFFVEGKKQLGFLFNDFANQKIDNELIGKIINTAIIYSIDLDLITPPLNSIMSVTVAEMNEITSAMSLKTGKRVGFRFSNDKANPH